MKGLPRRIVRWYWQLVLLIVVSGWASLTIAQRGDASRGISELLSELRANSLEQRQEGFYKLLETGIGDKFNGRTDRIPSALNTLMLSYPDEANQLKTSLIALLNTENSVLEGNAAVFLPEDSANRFLQVAPFAGICD
jgi:hypothetical protein